MVFIQQWILFHKARRNFEISIWSRLYKKWLKLTMISENVNQSEQRILYLITI